MTVVELGFASAEVKNVPLVMTSDAFPVSLVTVPQVMGLARTGAVDAKAAMIAAQSSAGLVFNAKTTLEVVATHLLVVGDFREYDGVSSFKDFLEPCIDRPVAGGMDNPANWTSVKNEGLTHYGPTLQNAF